MVDWEWGGMLASMAVSNLAITLLRLPKTSCTTDGEISLSLSKVNYLFFVFFHKKFLF